MAFVACSRVNFLIFRVIGWS